MIMTQPIWLLPALPFLGFMILALSGRYFSKKAVAATGIGAIALSFLYALYLGSSFMADPSVRINVNLWEWIRIGSFAPSLSLSIDSLTYVFILVITGVGGLIHWYSAEYMAEEEGYARFFAYMNLFVGFMLTLVMASNLLVLYLGWEGVGLCSYLLIGFYYRRGIGSRLMAALEAAVPEARRFELFTGHRSEGNLRLYARLGYREFRRQSVNERLTLVYMEKRAAPDGRSAS